MQGRARECEWERDNEESCQLRQTANTVRAREEGGRVIAAAEGRRKEGGRERSCRDLRRVEANVVGIGPLERWDGEAARGTPAQRKIDGARGGACVVNTQYGDKYICGAGTPPEERPRKEGDGRDHMRTSNESSRKCVSGSAGRAVKRKAKEEVGACKHGPYSPVSRARIQASRAAPRGGTKTSTAATRPRSASKAASASTLVVLLGHSPATAVHSQGIAGINQARGPQASESLS